MARRTKTLARRAPGEPKPSPALGAINRIRAATEKAHRDEDSRLALRDKARDRLVKTGALPTGPRTFS